MSITWNDALRDNFQHETRYTPNDFTYLRETQQFSDAIIKVADIEFPVHRNILSCCSPYFRALFICMYQSRESAVSISPLRSNRAASSRKTIRDADQCLPPETKRIKSSNQSSVGHSSQNCQTSKTRKNCEAVAANVKTNTEVKSSSSFKNPNSVRTASIHKLCIENPRNMDVSDNNSVSTQQTPVRDANDPFKESQNFRCEVFLSDVSPDAFNTILDYAYGGDIVVDANNVEQLVTAADRFQVTGLLNICCQFLSKQLSINNCISLVKFVSQFFTCQNVHRTAARFLLKHFVEVYEQSPEFNTLNVEELSAILRSDELNVKHEVLVLDAIIRWVRYNPDTRQALIPKLVACSRVGLMAPWRIDAFADSWLHTKVDTVHYIGSGSGRVERLCLTVMEAVLQIFNEQLVKLDPAMFVPRIPQEIIFVFGGSNFGFPLNLVEVFDCRSGQWKVICPEKFAPRSYHGMVTLDNEIYIVGGFNGQGYLSTCCKLLPETLDWEDVNPMNIRRCYVAVAVLRGYIYAVGGYDGATRLRSAERFDKTRNQWSLISPMILQRSDAGIAALDNRLYVCGGFNGATCMSAAEVYNPDNDLWEVIPNMPQNRSGLAMTSYGGCLYAVGGFDGLDSSIRLAVVECYSPQTKQWTQLESMCHPRSNLAVEVLEDLLYAVGGYNGEHTTAVVECYNFMLDSWFEASPLIHNRSALGVCIVKDLENASTVLRREENTYPMYCL